MQPSDSQHFRVIGYGICESGDTCQVHFLRLSLLPVSMPDLWMGIDIKIPGAGIQILRQAPRVYLKAITGSGFEIKRLSSQLPEKLLRLPAG